MYFFLSATGCGRTGPDPSGTITDKSGVVIPAGVGVDTSYTSSSLLYNEYLFWAVLDRVTGLCKILELHVQSFYLLSFVVLYRFGSQPLDEQKILFFAGWGVG